MTKNKDNKPVRLSPEIAGLTNQMGKPKQRKTDGYLKAAAVTLAAGCAILPFAVYMQRADFSDSARTPGQITDPLNRTQQKNHKRFPSFKPVEEAALEAEIDPSTTATIMSNGKGLPGVGFAERHDLENQLFPEPVFRLRDVAGGLAMIEDNSGYWFVESGSLLPDGSALESINQTDGRWRITTSTGNQIDQSH